MFLRYHQNLRVIVLELKVLHIYCCAWGRFHKHGSNQNVGGVTAVKGKIHTPLFPCGTERHLHASEVVLCLRFCFIFLFLRKRTKSDKTQVSKAEHN